MKSRFQVQSAPCRPQPSGLRPKLQVSSLPQVSGFPPAFALVPCQQKGDHPEIKLISEITLDCLELPSVRRLKLARILIDVSDPSQDFSPEVQAAWDDEIQARVEAARNGSAKSRPPAGVFARLDQLYPA